jgi:hypothetical protein
MQKEFLKVHVAVCMLRLLASCSFPLHFVVYVCEVAEVSSAAA